MKYGPAAGLADVTLRSDKLVLDDDLPPDIEPRQCQEQPRQMRTQRAPTAIPAMVPVLIPGLTDAAVCSAAGMLTAMSEKVTFDVGIPAATAH
jgi:hypothetical protein